MITDLTSKFSEIYCQLPRLDFSVLGDTSSRQQFQSQLGDIHSQKIRLCKLFALRKLIKSSVRVKPAKEQERMKQRNQAKLLRLKDSLQSRKQALRVLNSD